MVVETLEHDTTQDNVKGTEGDTKQGQGPEEPVSFGLVDNSNGANGDVKEGDHLTDANLPKDAVDEWPAAKKIHTFYFIRYRTIEDPKLKAKIDHADKEITKSTQSRLQITEALKAKRSERSNVISQLKPLTAEDKQYRMIMDEKRKSMEPLQDALGKLRSANIAVREKGVGLCSSEEELNDLIYSLHYRMQHETLTLVEEKQLIKEIKLLEGTREKVIANATEKAKIQDSYGHRDAIQGQVKLINDDIGGIKKEKQAVRMKIKDLEEELKAIDDEISSLQEELDVINKKRNKAYETLIELRKSRDEVNACYFQNRSLLNRAKDLAAKKDITSLEDLMHSEVEQFMSEWSSNKAFREDYEKRILSSLDSRQLSRDGRMRNPDEKPIISEAPATRDVENLPAKVNAKQASSAKEAKEDKLVPPQQDVISNKKVQDTNIKKSPEVESRGKVGDPVGTGDSYTPEKSQKELPKPTENDVAKLKEIKREEEIAKAKLALERKKKQAEKAAAKAVVRAQKEAEKKLKEKEKRAKKKAGASAPADSTDEADAEAKVSEPEEATVDAPVAEKTKEQKETVRYRNRPRGRDQVPKVILRRKKQQSYWIWAAPAAAVAALLLVSLGYYFIVARKQA
ncbi:proton pump-interactor 1 [Musa acuminata AAA Group]|uniref:proton pump-interactor 1 n=1 Tax=Musa acuminata AAA Group TaxID=214697 RepID=UPI0031CE094D